MEVIASNAAADLMERVATPELINGGHLTVISLEEIKERSRSRWSARRDLVAEHMERQFRRDFSDADHLIELDECAWLLSQPTQTPEAGAGRAQRLARQTLDFFLGKGAGSTLKVVMVTGVADGAVQVAPFSPETLALAQAQAALEVSPEGGGKATPTSAAASTSAPRDVATHSRRARDLMVAADRLYKVFPLIEPLWNIRKRAVVSYLLRPIILELTPSGDAAPADLSDMSARDTTAIDDAVLRFALDILSDAPQRRFMLQTPVHLRTIGSMEGRRRISTILSTAGDVARASLVFHLIGVDQGTPLVRLVEACGVLSTQAGLVLRAPGLEANLASWSGLRLQGVSVDFFGRRFAGESLGFGKLARFIDFTDGVGVNKVAEGVLDRATLVAAWAAGFTHISGDVISLGKLELLDAVRLDPAELFPPALA